MTQRIHRHHKTDETSPVVELHLVIQRAFPQAPHGTWRHHSAKRALLEMVSTLGTVVSDAPRLAVHVERVVAGVLQMIETANQRERLQQAIELVSLGGTVDLEGLIAEILEQLSGSPKEIHHEESED